MEVAVYLRDAGFNRMLIVNNLSGKTITAKVNISAEVISANDAPSIMGVLPCHRDGYCYY